MFQGITNGYFYRFETKSSMTCASVKAQIVPAAYRTKFNIRGSKASVKKLPDAISTPVPRPVMAEITSQTAFPDILINTDPTAKHTRTALPQGPPSSPPPFKMPSMTRTRTYTARRVGRAPRTNTQAPPPTPAKGGEENLDIVLGNIDGTPCTEAETKELEEKMKKEREKVHGTYVKKELRDIAATQRQRALWKTRENKKGANWL